MADTSIRTQGAPGGPTAAADAMLLDEDSDGLDGQAASEEDDDEATLEEEEVRKPTCPFSEAFAESEAIVFTDHFPKLLSLCCSAHIIPCAHVFCLRRRNEPEKTLPSLCTIAGCKGLLPAAKHGTTVNMQFVERRSWFVMLVGRCVRRQGLGHLSIMLAFVLHLPIPGSDPSSSHQPSEVAPMSSQRSHSGKHLLKKALPAQVYLGWTELPAG